MESKRRTNNPDGSRTKKKLSKEQLQLALVKKKQCDAKALVIVERLLENDVSRSWLLENLEYITRSHMEDVVEERAILKRCGYPLCDNPLILKINQRYHISTRSNKVYDVSRRKNFCNNGCYGAANYLLEQMLTSPLWSRDQDSIPQFQLLDIKDASQRAVPGDEVDLGIVNINVQTDNVSKSKAESSKDSVESSDKVLENATDNESSETTCQKKSTGINKTVTYGDIVELQMEHNDENYITEATQSEEYGQRNDNVEPQVECIDKSHAINAVQSEIDTNVHRNEVSMQHKDKRHKKKERKKRLEESNEANNSVARVERCLKEWVTLETLVLLLGEEAVKRQKFENVVLQDKYNELCKKLNRLQVEEQDKSDEVQIELQPLPDFSVLQEEGKKMEIKVRAFFDGRTALEPLAEATREGDKKDVQESSNILPLVDAHAQKTLRKRIILDRLNRVLPDLLRTLAGSESLIWGTDSNMGRGVAVKALVNTFALSANNIVFKPVEWNLLGLAIIKMLSLMEPRLKFLLNTKQALTYTAMILMTYKQEPNYLDTLLMSLTDITHLFDLENQCLSTFTDSI